MRLIKNAFVCFWPATDNKHFYVFLAEKSVLCKHIFTLDMVCKFMFMCVFQVLHQKLSKSGVLGGWEKH